MSAPLLFSFCLCLAHISCAPTKSTHSVRRVRLYTENTVSPAKCKPESCAATFRAYNETTRLAHDLASSQLARINIMKASHRLHSVRFWHSSRQPTFVAYASKQSVIKKRDKKSTNYYNKTTSIRFALIFIQYFQQSNHTSNDANVLSSNEISGNCYLCVFTPNVCADRRSDGI